MGWQNKFGGWNGVKNFQAGWQNILMVGRQFYLSLPLHLLHVLGSDSTFMCDLSALKHLFLCMLMSHLYVVLHFLVLCELYSFDGKYSFLCMLSHQSDVLLYLSHLKPFLNHCNLSRYSPMIELPIPFAVLSHSPTVSRYPPTLSIQDDSPPAGGSPAVCLLCLRTKCSTTSSNALLLEAE